MGKKRGPRHQTLDEVLLAKLIHESQSIDPASMDIKIRRSLKYYGYDVAEGMQRVPRLRTFKNRVVEAVGLGADGDYYVRPPEKQGFAAMDDFDIEAFHRDLAAAFPSIDHRLVGGFIGRAIYEYYLR